MKLLLLALLYFSVAPACARAEAFRDDQIIHDLGDDGIQAIASRLGLRYDERGMGINELGRGRYAFEAMAPGWGCGNGLTPAQQRKWAATPKPLVLAYYSTRKSTSESAVNAWNADSWRHISVACFRDGNASLSATLFVAHGITFQSVLEYFRRFTREIREFEAHLKHSKPTT